MNELNIPMSRKELSEFLDVSTAVVEALWDFGLLQRTIACHHRPTGAILHSTAFDALEYGLTTGDLPKRLSPEQAALWVFCLAEFSDRSENLEGDVSEQSRILYQTANDEGLTQRRPDGDEIAAVVVAKYHEILALMSKTDIAACKSVATCP